MCCVPWQGLLFKVNGVSVEAPVYSALTSLMLLLCAAFLLSWLAIAVIRIVQQAALATPGTNARSPSRWLPHKLLDKLSDWKGSATVRHDDVGTSGRGTALVADAVAVQDVDGSSRALTIANPLRQQRVQRVLRNHGPSDAVAVVGGSDNVEDKSTAHRMA